jgi:hypothetical protein
MFETFNVPFFRLVSHPQAVLYAAEQENAVVVDISSGAIRAVSCYGGIPINHSSQVLPFGINRCLDRLIELLVTKGYSFTTTAEREIVRDILEKHAYVARDFEAELAAPKEVNYELPDGQAIALSSELFRAPEILFQSSEDLPSLCDAVVKSLQTLDSQACPLVARNIILCGGGARIRGIAPRLNDELKKQLPFEVSVSVLPDAQFGHVAALTERCERLPGLTITKQEYDQYGPSIANRLFWENATSGIRLDGNMKAMSKAALALLQKSSAEKAHSNVAAKCRVADSNVALFSLGVGISQKGDTLMRKPIFCECGGALSHLTRVKADGWTCDFCNKAHSLNQPPLLESNAVTYSTSSLEDSGSKTQKHVVFVLDLSGTMSTIVDSPDDDFILDQRVDVYSPSNYDKTENRRSFYYDPATNESAWEKPEGGNWLLWSQVNTMWINRITNEPTFQDPANTKQPYNFKPVPEKPGFISTRKPTRLMAIQAAVHTQIEAIRKTSPDTVVSLIGFAAGIEVYGDGLDEELFVNESDAPFDSFDRLSNLGYEYRHLSSNPVHTSCDMLLERLYKLTARGITALGPAVAIACGMVKSNPGSKIIVCTDGVANHGIGNLTLPSGKQDYVTIANFAKKHGTSISVLSVEGEKCELDALGTVADLTNGSIEIVNPLDMATAMEEMLRKQTIATNLTAKVLLSKPLKTEDNSPIYIREYGSGMLLSFA